MLNGTKTFCTNGHYADVVVVIAVTDRAAHTHGLSAFVVEKGTPGFKLGQEGEQAGLRASDTAELIFEDCVVPCCNLVGQEGSGFVDAMRILDGGRISIAALVARHGPGRVTRRRSSIPSNASNSAKPSANFRPSSGSWPTWPPRSTPPGCSPCAPRR